MRVSIKTNYVGPYTTLITRGGVTFTQAMNGPVVSQNRASGTVVPGPIPPATWYQSFSSLLWLSYASGERLANGEEDRFPGFYLSSTMPCFFKITQTGAWEKNSLPPHLPKVFWINNTGVFLTVSPDCRVIARPRGGASTNFHFFVESWTNFAGFVLPRVVKAQMASETVLEATNFVALDRLEDFKPALPLPCFVTDFRVLNEGMPKIYLAERGLPQLPELNRLESMMNPKDVARQTAPGRPLIERAVRYTLLAAGLISVAFAVAIIAWWFYDRRKTNQQKQ